MNNYDHLYYVIQKDSKSLSKDYTYQQFYSKSLKWKKAYELLRKDLGDLDVSGVCLFFSLEFALKALILKAEPTYDLTKLGHSYEKMQKIITKHWPTFQSFSYVLLDKFNLLSGNINAIDLRYPNIGDQYYFAPDDMDRELRMFFHKLKEHIL